MKTIKLTALFAILVSFAIQGNANSNNTPPRKDRNSYTCKELMIEIDKERAIIQDCRIKINKFRLVKTHQKRVLELQEMIRIHSAYKKTYQDYYKTCDLSVNGGVKYGNKNKDKKAYTDEDMIAKYEKNKKITQQNNSKAKEIKFKKDDGGKLSKGEESKLKAREKEIKAEDKLISNAKLKEKELADQRAKNIKKNKESAIIKEWKNELKKNKIHTLQYTLENKILFTEFDKTSPNPVIDYYREVYKQPINSLNLLYIKNKYLVKTSPTYIARSNQNIKLEPQVIELFKLIEFNKNITNPNIVLKISSMKSTVIEVLNNIYPIFSSHMEVMRASSTPR
jgi:hypothetical protein